MSWDRLRRHVRRTTTAKLPRTAVISAETASAPVACCAPPESLLSSGTCLACEPGCRENSCLTRGRVGQPWGVPLRGTEGRAER